MEYRLEEHTGEIYTKEEFLSVILGPTEAERIELERIYNDMSVVPTEGMDIEELKRKLKGIYWRGKIRVSDIVLDNTGDQYYVTSTKGKLRGRKFKPSADNIETYLPPDVTRLVATNTTTTTFSSFNVTSVTSPYYTVNNNISIRGYSATMSWAPVTPSPNPLVTVCTPLKPWWKRIIFWKS